MEALKRERRTRWASVLDKRDVAPAGEIVYVNPNPPGVPLKPYTGRRYRDRAPDTYDVAERAALCINALTGATNPRADYELYFRASFFGSPAVMSATSDDWCQPKFMEGLPLLRVVSGSQLRLEVDETWHRVTLKSIGPDGLFYLPLSGRPWMRGGRPVACADGKTRGTRDPAVTQFSHSFLNFRMMNAMMNQYQRDSDPRWIEMTRKMIDRLGQLAVVTGDIAYWPGMCFEPNARYDATPVAFAMPKGLNAVEAGGGNGLLPLARFVRLTGNKSALTLGKAVTRYIRRDSGYFGNQGEFIAEKHFHGHTLILLGLLEFATVADDRDTLEFVRKSYEWAKTPAAGSSDTIGFFPELAHPSFTMCESCEIADMIGIALKLSKAGVGDYYNDAERWTRNHFAESQLTEEQVPLVYYLSGAQPQTPVAENETAWRVAERNVGTFAGWSRANDWAAGFDGIQHCCTGNTARTLYWIWQEALRFKDGELRVSLLLNRASRQADVYSFIPYQGKVEIKIKEPCANVLVHAPGWVKAGSPEMTAAVDGKAAKTGWKGRYLVLGPAKPGQHITVTSPIAERTVKETIGTVEYTMVLKGDTVVHMDPPGKNLPLYRRDHYRSSEPRYVEVERFLSDKEVEY